LIAFADVRQSPRHASEQDFHGGPGQERTSADGHELTATATRTATAEDLIAGLNDTRPHVVHFSGHAGDAALLFDNASVTDPDGQSIRYDLLARALGATTTPPVLLVLNGCDTLEGADVLLERTAVVIATGASISDLAGSVFAAKFYAAIAAAQSIGAAVDQATFAIDAAGLGEGWKHDAIARSDIDVDQRVLVQPSRVGS
jgi:CHAT domain